MHWIGSYFSLKVWSTFGLVLFKDNQDLDHKSRTVICTLTISGIIPHKLLIGSGLFFHSCGLVLLKVNLDTGSMIQIKNVELFITSHEAGFV